MKFLQNIEPREYQKAIFKTCKEKNCLVVLPTGLGKCLEFSQPVLMKNGTLIKIGELFEKIKGKIIQNKKDHIIKKPLEKKEVISLNESLKFGKRKIIALHKIKTKKSLLKITSCSGAEIIVTPEHPLLTLNDKLEWKRADKFNLGEVVATPSSIPGPKNNQKIDPIKIFQNINSNMNCYVELDKKFYKKNNLEKEQKLSELLTKQIKKEELIENIKYFYVKGSRADQTKIKVIKKTSPELFYWAGLIIAEGSMHGGIKFYNNDKGLLKLFVKLSKKLFGITPTKIKGGLKLSSTALYFFTRNIFEMSCNQHSRDKKISNIIMTSPNNYVAKFISALYDGEGSVREDGLIEFITASKKLSNNLCYLLLRFNIKGRITKKICSAANSSSPKKRPYYRIYLEGKKDLENFYEKIGFNHKEKQKKLKRYLSKNINYNPNLIPISGQEIKKIRNTLKLSSTKYKDFKIASIDTYERNERQFSHETLKKIINDFKQQINQITKTKDDILWLTKQLKLLETPPKEILTKIESKIKIEKYLKYTKISNKLYSKWKNNTREPRLHKTYPFMRLLKIIPIKTEYSNFQLTVLLNKIKKIQRRLKINNHYIRIIHNFCCLPTKRKELIKYLKILINEYDNKIKIKEKIEFLEKLLDSHIYWDKIKTIEKVKEEWVYDISLDKNFNFIAGKNGGFIAHNTLIALMLTIHRMQEFPGEKVVFLAPTKPLAEQHLVSFTKNLPELFGEMTLFTGAINAEKRKQLWQNSDIIFSTPQCVANDLKKGLYSLQKVCLLIEDEAHRCVRNYDYNFIAQKYKSQAENKRILGLTASPSSDPKKIKHICTNLSIEEVELRTRDSEDVKQYLQELEFEKIKIDFPAELEEIRVVLKKLLHQYVEELRRRNMLYEFPSKTNLIKLQKNISSSISRGNRNFNYMLGASACAQAIKLQHALELLETQTIAGFNKYLQNLFNQAAKKQSKGVVKLVAKPEFNFLYSASNELLAKNKEHPKIQELINIIKQEQQSTKNFKAIVFSQFRDTASAISNVLNALPEITAKVFVGQAKKADGTPGLNQKQQKKIIEEFSEGKVNILCATCIAEEGLDIPEVNAVIFYEPIPSAIRSIQRRGRTARLMKGKLIMLITKNTRDESFYYVSRSREKKMHKTIHEIKQDLSEGKINFKDKQKTL